MLQVNYSNSSTCLNLTIFPKTILFLSSFTENDHKSFYRFFEKSKLKKNLGTSLDINIFKKNHTVDKNLDIISKSLIYHNLKDIIIKYFEVGEEIFLKKPQELTEEEGVIISTSTLLLNQTNIWILRLKDKTLSDFTKTKIEKILLSKVATSHSIIFYSTESGKMLDIEEQVILN